MNKYLDTKILNKTNKYPCKDCLVLTTCRELCDKFPKLEMPPSNTNSDTCHYCGSPVLYKKANFDCTKCNSIAKFLSIFLFIGDDNE